MRCRSLLTCCTLAVLALVSASVRGGDAADPHRQLNPLYRELCANGVPLGATVKQKLPAPLFADGLDAKEQTARLVKLAGEDYPLEELTRRSLVAPYVYKLTDVPTRDAAVLGRSADLWFVAVGRFDSLTHDNLVRLFQGVRKDSRLTRLPEEALTARRIKRQKLVNLEETYVHTSYPMLERVQVDATFHCVISRTKESVVLASRLDPAFAQDGKYPNQWRSLEADEAGNLKVGPPQPYEGVGAYFRITPLHTPEGALFVEVHQVFAEPAKWFNNPNLLRSKLPLAVQAEVRAFRRELAKLGK